MRRGRKRVLLAGKRLIWPECVPRSAEFSESGRNEGCIWGQFSYHGGKAQLAWSLKGNVLSERYFDAKGLGCGIEVTRHDDGTVEWQVPWVHGHMHGIARQFDWSGRELLRTRFIHGSGVDLWVNGNDVVELREYEESVPHGVVRWGHPLLPYEEDHYIRGKRAGIFRYWIGSQMEKGCPKYFIDDEEVSRAKYLRTRKARPELPAYRPQDDERERPMHPGLLQAWLRKGIRANLMRIPGPDEQVGCGGR